MLSQYEEVSFAPKTLLDGLFFDFTSYVIDSEDTAVKKAHETAPFVGSDGLKPDQDSYESATDHEPESRKFIHTNEIFHFTLPTDANKQTAEDIPDQVMKEMASDRVTEIGQIAQ